MSSETPIHKLIKPYKTLSGDETTKSNILCQNGPLCKSGKWRVPDEKYMVFLQKINDELVKNPGMEIHFMEIPNESHNMVKIDIDLRFQTTENEKKHPETIKRRYDDDFIYMLVSNILSFLSEIIKITKPITFYVQEKPAPRIIKENINQIKDGIHILIPDIVMPNEALFYLRKKIITNPDIIEAIKSIGNTSKIEDVFDKAVIYPNGWYIYGCGKPDDYTKYYKITKIIKADINNDTSGDNNEVDMEELQDTKNLLENIKLFSNFGKQINIEYNFDFDQEVLKEFEDNYDYNNKNFEENLYRSFKKTPGNIRNGCSLTQNEILPFLNCLKKERVDDYHDWLRVGLCLYNMDVRNYTLWNEWSSQSSKYKKEECLKFWLKEFPKHSKYDMGFNKLKLMAKTDNKDVYEKIINLNKMNFFNLWIQKHITEGQYIKGLSIDSLAKYIHTYIKDYSDFYIACTNPGATSEWYKFKDHRWSKDKSGNIIYMLMTTKLKDDLDKFSEELKLQSENVCKSFQTVKQDLIKKEETESIDSSISNPLVDNRPERVNPDQVRTLESQIVNMRNSLAKCKEIMAYICTPAHKNIIIQELSHICYDEEFLNKLDDNRNLFVVRNGVLDLDKGIFRPGDPSDMMTRFSNIYFPNDIDSKYAQDIILEIQQWLDSIYPDQDIQDYVMNFMATKLCGELFGEHFHIFTGSGANGKSQFFKAIAKAFGDYFQMFDNSLLNQKKGNANTASPAIASLKGARLAVTTEIKSSAPLESEIIKELISGDALRGRHLNKDPIEFIPQYAMIMMCNDIPNNESTDDGFWRKIFVVGMESKFILKEEDMWKLNDPDRFPNHYKAIHGIEKRYDEWAPYLLHMLFERFILLKNKNNDFKYNVPDKVRAATEKYKSEASSYTRFFNERVVASPEDSVDMNTLFAEYKMFLGNEEKPKKNDFIKQIVRNFPNPPVGIKKVFNGYKINDS